MGMKPERAGWIVVALAVACAVAGLGSAGVLAAARQVAWGTTASAPAGKLGELFGVAAVSPTDVLAIGGYNPGHAPTALLTNPYAERWNGTAWSATPVPLKQVYSPEQAQLNGAAVAGPAEAWAVGTVSDPSSLASQTLAYHWDGTAWSRSPTPDPAGPAAGNTLAAVTARTASDVWAAGGDGYPAASLVLHFNGTDWQQVSVPSIGPLDAVTTAPGRVWIAGGNRVEQYNGTAWTSLPPVAGLITGLAGTPAGLWAVGRVEYGCGEGGTCTANWAALWNGTAWHVVVSDGSTGLTGVTIAGQQVLASSANTVLHLTPTGASPQVTPYPGPAQLTAITAGRPGTRGRWAGPAIRGRSARRSSTHPASDRAASW